MKFSKKWLYIGIPVVLIGGLIVYSVTRKTVITYETEAVSRGEVLEEVSVTGSLSPTSKIALEPEATGRVVKLNVDEGADVKSGDVLVEIDARDVSSRINSQRASVDSAKARLAELTAGSTPQELAQAEAAVSSAVSRRDSAIAAKQDAEVSMTNAEQNRINVIAKGETLIVNKLSTLLLDYDSALSDARDAIDRLTQQLYTNDGQITITTNNFASEVNARNTRIQAFAAETDLQAVIASAKTAGSVDAAVAAYPTIAADLGVIKAHLEATRLALTFATSLDTATFNTYQTSVNSAVTSVDAAMLSVNRDKADIDLQKNLNASDLNSAQTAASNASAALTSAKFAVESAERSLAQAQADLAVRRSGSRPEVIASQRAQVAVQEATLSGLFTEFSKRRITAPMDGVVTDVAVSLGETVSPGKSVLTLQAKGNFEIITNISEIDVGKVTVGDSVTITLDAFPRTEKWTGKVVAIDPAEKVLEGVIFYETKVVFDSEDPRLRSGMTANLTVETDRRDNVLRVPLRGVKDRRDKTFVDVLVNGEPVEKEVVIGIQNNDYGEIISGLTEAELVVVSSTAP